MFYINIYTLIYIYIGFDSDVEKVESENDDVDDDKYEDERTGNDPQYNP
jgi:hypothetical protein